MVVLFGSDFEFLSDGSQLIFQLPEFPFVVQDQIFALPLTNAQQIQLFRKQVCFILLLGSQSIMRFLNELHLLVDNLELPFQLVLCRFERFCLFSCLLA